VPKAQGDGVMRDSAAVARFILDPANSNAAREAAVNANPQFAADLVAQMTEDLVPGTPAAEYERIPWIWRIAINGGRRMTRTACDASWRVSLPNAGEPLRDWQAVVIGGRSLTASASKAWPGER
jgi:hypothetical protein